MKFENWNGWHFHHLARRTKTYGLDKIASILETVGWKLTKTGNIPEFLIPDLEKSLTRIASIKNFDKTCDKPDCKVCKRVVKEFFSGKLLDIPWKISVELYRWQKEARKKWWENNGRGIVKVVTGAGKTIFALSLISDLFNFEAYQKGGLKVIVVVPTTVLLDQWIIEIMDKLHIPREEIGVYYGKEKENLRGKKILVYVVNSARRHLEEHFKEFLKGEDLFLIADECHRYGSKENSKIFKIPFSFTLGLSATPERYGDYGFEERIFPNIGRIIYSYTYTMALKDGVIPPYKIIRLKVSLTPTEEILYKDLTEKINRLSRIIISKYPEVKENSEAGFIKRLNKLYERKKDDLITKFISFLNQRKAVIHLSKAKLKAFKWLFENENLIYEKVLIFHERIEIAEYIHNYLENFGYKTSIYHSKMHPKERLLNISNFKDGIANILIACRALDEGFDVPSAETGIIIAGTSSVRQWIQRMGRILRKSPTKVYSKIFVIFVDRLEDDVFTKSDLEEFEREAMGVELINLI